MRGLTNVSFIYLDEADFFPPDQQQDARDVSERWLFILDITKLITALRTAVENGEGSLDKEATSHDDLMDAFRMSMLSWH